MSDMYNSLAYPHSMHRKFVRGCDECLQRTKAAHARYTESRRRTREYNKRRAEDFRTHQHLPHCMYHILPTCCSCGM